MRASGASAPGMLLAEAQSLWPAATNSVRFEQHDPLANRRALRDLALWCHRFSPIVAIDDAETPDCLLLEPVGSEQWAVDSKKEIKGQKSEVRSQRSVERFGLATHHFPLLTAHCPLLWNSRAIGQSR